MLLYWVFPKSQTMKPTTLNIKCLTLGHNFYKDASESSDKVSCRHCGVEAKIDSNGDIVSELSYSKSVENAFRQLFLLKRNLNSKF